MEEKVKEEKATSSTWRSTRFAMIYSLQTLLSSVNLRLNVKATILGILLK